MDRSNVATVLCAGQVKKWRGQIVGYDIPKLRAELDASRDYVFAAAGIERDLFRARRRRERGLPPRCRTSTKWETISALGFMLPHLSQTGQLSEAGIHRRCRR